MFDVKLDYNMSAWKKTLIAGLISYIDAGSIVAGASGLTMWQDYLGMSSVQMGLLAALSSNTGGAAIGALIGGKICDKYGRKFVYNWALLIYMIGVAIICLATNYPMFLLGYVIVGLMVGADVVASWTFIAEEAPSRNRAKHCGSAQIAWMLGPVVVFAASIPMNEMFGLLGNRLIFAHLIVVAAWIWYQRLKMPESTEWAAAKKQEEELAAKGIKQKKVRYADILRGTSFKTVALCVCVYAFWNLAASTNGFFMPYVYEHVGNLSNSMALGMTALNFAVCIVTTIIFMYTADKFNRRKVYAIFSGLGVISWFVWALPGEMLQTWMLFFFTIVWGFSMQQQFYQLWSSELFPVRYRATAQGFTFFVTRFSAAIWGFAVPLIMEALGFQIAAVLMIGFCVVSWLAGTIWGGDDRGKTLDEITRDRYGDEIDENGWLVEDTQPEHAVAHK
ncbi:MFS transporter [Selenomonas ruminantium]|uniref:MFS transporter, SP family, inositol transporter n=1 Tax=Selenomonas ruminantium TaxID=971 RepID=A0A1H3VVJ7_SELRU|nr:MFS transporter [Selenomonas ruminantium]SDZ78711.1 MFS transporter, SP family, inositol transporter [Selenomonas ruminantium]